MNDFRQRIRSGLFTGHTSGYFTDKAQVNIVITEGRYAEEFAAFCAQNPTPCPIVYSSKPGEYLFPELGGIDIQRDVPVYNIYRNGKLTEEKYSIEDIWQNHFVCFCIGCSFTFDKALTDEGIRLKHVEVGKNVAMYKSSIPLKPTTLFKGNMVVSMRWIDKLHTDHVVKISSRYPDFHGAPVHIGNPEEIGISTIERPDYGDYVTPEANHIPVFWGCGVTPQACLAEAKLPIVITHKPGSMLITNLTHKEIMQNKNTQSTKGNQ